MAGKGDAKTGGRQKGTPNKATREVKTLAREHGPEAIQKLVKLMRGHDARLDQLADKIDEIEPDGKESENLLRELVALLAGRNVANELGAAKELLDRGYGKAVMHLDAEISVYDQLSFDDKIALAAAIDALIDDEEGDANDEATRH